MSMSKYVRIIVLLVGCNLVFAGSMQAKSVSIPFMQLTGFPLFGTTGTTTQAAPTTTAAPVTSPAPAVAVPDEEPDSLKKKKLENSNSEEDLRRLEIQKERILLERELNELKSQGLNTLQDTINLEIKTKNLQLLYLKEQLLLKEELKQMGGLRDYGSSGIFGHHFFREGGIKFFQKATDATPSGSYVLGNEDKLHLEVWGYSTLSADLEIGSDGYANLPYGQKVYLRGISLEGAKKLIRQKMSSMVDLRTSTLDISVVKFRTITVHIVGEVFKPGSYVIPAINTAFNALTVMGGPTNIGSVRKIYIKRNGKLVDSLDAYNYMLNPKKSREVYLQDNDYIIVEPIGKVVTVNGALRRPGSYELKEDEDLNELLEIAAGINPTTYLEDVLVTRVRENKYYEQIALNYDSLLKSNKNFKLLKGDLIEFKSITDDDFQTLNITGAVNIPGVYKVSKTSSIKDLVAQANGLLTEAYTEEAYLIRTNDDYTKTYISFNLAKALEGKEDTLKVQPFDEIYVFSLKNYLLIGNLSIKGAVRNPQSMVFAEDMTLRDFIFIAGGVLPETFMERGILTRTNNETNEKQTIVFNVKDVLENPNSAANLSLERNDAVEIFSKVKFRDKYTVNIDGEVHDPGQVEFSSEMTLKDLIYKAGGLSTSAINSKIEIVRSFKFGDDLVRLVPIPAEVIVMEIGAVLDLDPKYENFIIYPFDQVSIRKNPFYLEQRTVTLTGAVMYPGVYTLLSEDEKIASVIERAGGLRSYASTIAVDFKRLDEGGNSTNIVVDIAKAIKNPKSNYNYILRDKDEIDIPVSSSLVSISGLIVNKDHDRLSIYYKKHRRARHYIRQYAGGFEDDACKRKTYVVYANGTAKKTRNFLFFNVFPKPKPGSEIIAVAKPAKKVRRKFGQNLEETTVKITAIMSLVLMYALIQQSFK